MNVSAPINSRGPEARGAGCRGRGGFESWRRDVEMRGPPQFVRLRSQIKLLAVGSSFRSDPFIYSDALPPVYEFHC